jgi:uncharacterized protein (TIGR03086 family)
MTDVAGRYDILAGSFLDRIRATPAERWDAPSPCDGWTARDVVAHVINGHRGVLAAVSGRRPEPADGVGVCGMADAPEVAPGADLAVAFGRCRQDLHLMLSDPARAATPLPGGLMRGEPVERAADIIGATELLVHTWDLARAVGGDEAINPELAARTHQALLPYYPALQATGAFQPSIPAPPGADPQTAFLYFVGRRP